MTFIIASRPNVYSSSPLDRAATKREDTAWIEQRLHDPDTLLVPVWRNRNLVRGMDAVREFRRERNDSYNFNWLLHVDPELQRHFEVTHESMRALELRRSQPAHLLAANLRRAFSGIVTGNVKERGIQAIERQGPYELNGDPEIMQLLDELLTAFVEQQRMRLPGSTYKPVYRLVA